MLARYVDPLNPKNVYAEITFDNEEIRIERRLFDIKTYADFRRKEAQWLKVAPANRFIATLDKDEQDYLVRLFVRAKRDLSQVRDRQSMMNAIEAIDAKVAKTFQKMNLSKRIFDFIVNDKDVSLPDFAGVGTRAQDTRSMTFLKDDFDLMNTIVIIAKILFPLFGEIISKVQVTEDTHSGVKEVVAFGIVNTLLSRDFDSIIQKLYNYISKLIESSLSDDPMLAFYGITETSLTYDKVAKMVVKNFVNLDIYRPGGNIMRVIATTVKRSFDMETVGQKKTLAYKSRTLPEGKSEESSNVSLLENSIKILHEPVDTPIIAKLAVSRFVESFIIKNSISRARFDKAVKFYKVTTIQPTPINEMLVGMFIADPVGAAYCVKYMTMELIVEVIVLMQIYAMRMGFNAVVPVLSMLPTGLVKTKVDRVDNDILMTEGRGTNPINFYMNIKETVAHLADFTNFKFEDTMGDIKFTVVNIVNSYNVAPTILEVGDTAPTINDNGIMRYDTNVISEIYRFIYFLLTTDRQRIMTV